MIRKIAVVAAALSLLFTGVAGADDKAADCHNTCVKALYPPEPPVEVVKVIKTVEKVEKVKAVPAQQGQLPRTGADSLPLTQIGAGLLAVGAVLVLLERNRRAAHSQHVDIS